MNSFYILPNDIFKEFIFRFLIILDIMNFEKAITSGNFDHDLINNLTINNNMYVEIHKFQLQWMYQRLIHIQSIRFDTRITDYDIIHSSNILSKIVHINFNDCKYITDATIECLCKCINNNRKQIRSLNLTNCSNITKKSIELISHNGQNLQSIILKHCYFHSQLSIREQYLINLIEESKQNLLKLDIEGLNISNNLLLSLCNNSNNLNYLNINYSYMVTDKMIELLCIQCPQLQTLMLNSCFRLSDIALMSISNYCKKIEYIDVRDCRKITNDGILNVKNNCINLVHIQSSTTF